MRSWCGLQILASSCTVMERAVDLSQPSILRKSKKRHSRAGKVKHVGLSLLVSFSFNAPQKNIGESMVFLQTCFFVPLSLVTMTIITALLLRIKLDHCVDSHDGHTGLDSTLQLLDLAHCRLQNTHLQTVDNTALGKVQTVVLVVLLLGERFFVLGGRLYSGCSVGVAATTFRGREAL